MISSSAMAMEITGKYMRKKTKLWSTKRADLEFSHHIRDRDERKCFFCGKEGSQNSHFWGRGNSATRYDPENCDYACGGCHMRHEGNKQGLYREKKIAQLGEEDYMKLQKRSYSIMKRSDAILRCMEYIGDNSI